MNPVFSYTASESLATDAWGSLVQEVTNTVTLYSDLSSERLAALFHSWEEEFKQETGGKPLPGSYRSAKSVIKNASEHHIPLTDGEGEPRGKTAVEKGIKSKRVMESTETLPPVDMAARLYNTFYAYCVKHDLLHSIYHL